MEAARFRFAVSATTACLTVLGIAGLAPDLPRREVRPTPPPAGGPPAPPPAGPRTTIRLDPADAPLPAAAREPACAAALGGGPYPDEDVWVFGLPAGATGARFVTVTPEFVTPNRERVALTVPTEGGALVVDDAGADVAWLRLPAGWTLVGGSAVLAEDAGSFVLARVCPASATPSA
ncbi:hypothetical protein [Micromonospora sp. ATCC 39149]|uniref:Uncharacterized protein n=1 Tax=Micromonospora carbonacea TaxID=47853 RepID=A0A7D6CBN7_9ACTN|nr:hypothetical protein [Micromonospora sp. ATCC 39149]QLJ98145.1 hypothetical protein HZU44_26050 [Micromonospora carbonacea]